MTGRGRVSRCAPSLAGLENRIEDLAIRGDVRDTGGRITLAIDESPGRSSE